MHTQDYTCEPASPTTHLDISDTRSARTSTNDSEACAERHGRLESYPQAQQQPHGQGWSAGVGTVWGLPVCCSAAPKPQPPQQPSECFITDTAGLAFSPQACCPATPLMQPQLQQQPDGRNYYNGMQLPPQLMRQQTLARRLSRTSRRRACSACRTACAAGPVPAGSAEAPGRALADAGAAAAAACHRSSFGR